MPSGADATKANWQALRRLAVLLFARLHKENPDWDFRDLEGNLSLPDAKLFQKLAEEAGFELGGALSPAQQNKILRAMLREIFSPEEIARATKLPLPEVKGFLEQVGVSFGAGGYGMFPLPGDPEKADDGAAPVAQPRRVSAKGQFSYKGRTYGLGSACAGRVCWVVEADSRLVVRFSDRPAIVVCR